MNLITCQPAIQVILPQPGFIKGVLNPNSGNEPPDMRCGYGACSVSGCNCPAYMGNDNTCSNCGHNYQSH